MKAVVETWLNEVLTHLKANEIIPKDFNAKINVTHTKDESHGDFASNLALMLAKPAKKAPREIAELIVKTLGDKTEIDKMEIAGPGFINFFLSQSASTQVIESILSKGKSFGRSNIGQGKPVGVEYVSANPTGPLHIGHGRGAVVGDCLARLLKATGWNVTREFYYNDAGQQIINLACSVQARAKKLTPESDEWQDGWYNGLYIIDVANAYVNKETVESSDKHVTGKGDINDLDAILEFAVAYLRKEQDLDLKAFEVNFDVFFLESSLYEKGDVEATVKQLQDSGHTYERDGALWLKTLILAMIKIGLCVSQKAVTLTFYPMSLTMLTNGTEDLSVVLANLAPIITVPLSALKLACKR